MKAHSATSTPAISVHSYKGGGLNSHLMLTITPAAYLAIAGVPFVPPIAAQITEANGLLLVRRQKTMQLYHDVDKALVCQITAATPAIYLNAINDCQSVRFLPWHVPASAYSLVYTVWTKRHNSHERRKMLVA